MLRWAGVVLISLAWLPAVAASMLVLVDRAGEHEVRCSVSRQGFEVTLHHPEGLARSGHHHNLLEKAILGNPTPADPDHHLGFARSEQWPDGEALAITGDRPADPDALPVAILPPPPSPVDLPGVDERGSELRRGPPASWRGVVMRV